MGLKITVEPTDEIVDVVTDDGVTTTKARVWTGVTEGGARVRLFGLGITPHKDDQAAFDVESEGILKVPAAAMAIVRDRKLVDVDHMVESAVDIEANAKTVADFLHRLSLKDGTEFVGVEGGNAPDGTLYVAFIMDGQRLRMPLSHAELLGQALQYRADHEGDTPAPVTAFASAVLLATRKLREMAGGDPEDDKPRTLQ